MKNLSTPLTAVEHQEPKNHLVLFESGSKGQLCSLEPQVADATVQRRFQFSKGAKSSVQAWLGSRTIWTAIPPSAAWPAPCTWVGLLTEGLPWC